MCNIKRIETHSHTSYSNIRLLDATAQIDELIQTAADLGLGGISITDHETVAAHVKAIQKVRELKQKNKIAQDFKLILGNEIYLVDDLQEVRDNYQSGITKFPHFILLAKDAKSHEILRFLSSKAWESSFYTGTMERVPTVKADLEEVVRQNPNKLIATSACLGSESSIHILNGDYDKARSFLKWCADLFGKDNFFLELQPSSDEEQRPVNEKLIEFSSELELDLIVASDVHYVRPEDAEIHSAFLNSKEGDRETSKFYANTYLHSNDEIIEKLSYINKSIVEQAILNTLKISDMVEDYTIEAPTIIPKIDLPEFELLHLFKQGYEQYPYFEKLAYSDNEQDRYYLHLIEKGFIEHIPYKTITKDYFHQILSRLNVEFEQLWEMSQQINQAMTSYYVTVAKIVELMWGDSCGDNSRNEGSLVGSGRGSAVAFLSNYLLNITQVSPLNYGIEVPYWRHLHKSRADISALDVDLDINGNKKQYIFNRIKESFGDRKFLQVCTYGTQGSKSAIQTACRGLGIDTDTAQYLSSLIPYERGENWSLSDCIIGNPDEGRSPVKELIRELDKYPKLKQTAMRIEGLIDKRSIHAGGVLILNDDFVKTNAAQRAPNGALISQYNLDDSQAMGNIKYDILVVDALSKIQATMDLLIDAGEMEWQGTLRKTFNKYLHPEVIDKESPILFEMAGSGKIPDLFQFSTSIGQSTIAKVKPKNLIEMVATNSLMRLQSDGEEQPIDTFIRFKNNISLWYKEMREDFGLNDDEIKIMEEHILQLNGVCDTQESVLMLAMDERIAGFSVADSTVLRKSIAKKKKEEAEKAKELLYRKGLERGTRRELLDYVWHQIKRMLSYAFSSPHTLAYSLMAMEQLSLNKNYNPLYWNTAVLTVNAGAQEVEEDEKDKDTDYGKIANAISMLKGFGTNVSHPLINQANFGFTPDIENNRIVFGLKGIVGVGDSIVEEVIKHRPYSSFEDFYERLYKTKLIQKSHMLKLIKAGSFNEFGSPVEIMKKFIVGEVEVKDSLDGKNLKRIIGLGLLDDQELRHYKDYFNFREHISKNIHETIAKPKDRIFKLDDYSKAYFENNFSSDSIIGEHKGKLLISEKKFKKEYDIKMKPLMELIATFEFISRFNRAQFVEIWMQDANGTIPKWEMESISFYSGEHELSNVDFGRYGIVNFSDIPETPEVVEEYMWKGRQQKKFKLYSIVGTVLSKNKNKHTISLLTPEGSVVTVKTYGGAFSHYDKQISKAEKNGKKTTIEKSWFQRGGLLLLTGFRREDQFVLKTYKDSVQQHTINKIIEVRKDGSLGLQAERARQ